MKISIVIPVYNVEEYIIRCFNSVANQTYKNIECIFIDDESPDNCNTIISGLINEYSGPIEFTLHKHLKNKGLSGARNTGTALAKGEYIYYLDSDDSITENCIELLVDLVYKYKNVDIVQGNTMTLPESNMDGNWRDIRLKNYPEFVNDYLWIKEHCFADPRIPVNAWNKLIKMEFIIKNDLYFKEGIIHEDEQWMFFVSKHIDSIAFSKTYCYEHYLVPNSIMQSGNKGKSIGSWITILEDVFSNIDEPFSSLQKQYAYKESLNLLSLITYSGPYNQFIPAFRLLLKNQIQRRNNTLIEVLFLGNVLFSNRIIFKNDFIKKVVIKVNSKLLKRIFRKSAK